MSDDNSFKSLSLKEIELAISNGLSGALSGEVTTEIQTLQQIELAGLHRLSGTDKFQLSITITVPKDYSEGAEMFDADDEYPFG